MAMGSQREQQRQPNARHGRCAENREPAAGAVRDCSRDGSEKAGHDKGSGNHESPDCDRARMRRRNDGHELQAEERWHYGRECGTGDVEQ